MRFRRGWFVNEDSGTSGAASSERLTLFIRGRANFRGSATVDIKRLWWGRHSCLPESASAGHSCPAERIRIGSGGQECPPLTDSRQTRMSAPPSANALTENCPRPLPQRRTDEKMMFGVAKVTARWSTRELRQALLKLQHRLKQIALLFHPRQYLIGGENQPRRILRLYCRLYFRPG